MKSYWNVLNRWKLKTKLCNSWYLFCLERHLDEDKFKTTLIFWISFQCFFLKHRYYPRSRWTSIAKDLPSYLVIANLINYASTGLPPLDKHLKVLLEKITLYILWYHRSNSFTIYRDFSNHNNGEQSPPINCPINCVSDIPMKKNGILWLP